MRRHLWCHGHRPSGEYSDPHQGPPPQPRVSSLGTRFPTEVSGILDCSSSHAASSQLFKKEKAIISAVLQRRPIFRTVGELYRTYDKVWARWRETRKKREQPDFIVCEIPAKSKYMLHTCNNICIYGTLCSARQRASSLNFLWQSCGKSRPPCLLVTFLLDQAARY